VPFPSACIHSRIDTPNAVQRREVRYWLQLLTHYNVAYKGRVYNLGDSAESDLLILNYLPIFKLLKASRRHSS
jgi:hypothetical protein